MFTPRRGTTTATTYNSFLLRVPEIPTLYQERRRYNSSLVHTRLHALFFRGMFPLPYVVNLTLLCFADLCQGFCKLPLQPSTVSWPGLTYAPVSLGTLQIDPINFHSFVQLRERRLEIQCINAFHFREHRGGENRRGGRRPPLAPRLALLMDPLKGL